MNTIDASFQTVLEQQMLGFHLDHLGVLACEGLDAASFLQGQLTCDINEVSADTPKLAAYCNHKGRMLAIFWIFRLEDAYLLVLPQSILTSTRNTLKKYAVFSKVELRDASAEFNLYGVSGPDGTNQLQPLTNIALQHQLPGPIQRHLLISRTTPESPLFAEENCTSPSLWQLAEILAELPIITPQTQEKFTPHMVNLPTLGGVSLTKGCYLGQEIIARTEYLGKSKRFIKQMTLAQATPPTPGERLLNTDNEEIGIVLQSAPLIAKQYLALVVV